MPLPATQAQAMVEPMAHVLVLGIGYLRILQTDIARAHRLALPRRPLAGSCVPPASAELGSRHHLRAPMNGPVKIMTWVPQTQSWFMRGGKRIGFSAQYLASHGWAYLGPQ